MTAGTVRNCVITKNTAGTVAAAGGGGGGVWISGGLVHDCDIVGNTGRAGNDDGGGGVRMTGGVASNCLIPANQAVGSGAAGGGACLKHSSALMVDCILTQNTAAWGSCGAYIFPGRALRCTFTGNNGSNGAGVGMRDGGIVDSCIITNNTGDGVYYRIGYVRNSLIAKNTRYGVYTTQNGGEISSCTIADNGNTGVYLTGGGSLIRNNIIYGNTAIYGSSGLATATWLNNLTPAAVSGALVMSGNVVGDPLFASTSASDFRVLKTSPAIDAGLDLSAVGIVADVAGTPRPTRYGTDIGCYEEAQSARVLNLAPVATSSEAVLGGKLVYDGGLPTSGTLYWGTADGGTDKNAWQQSMVFDPVASGQVFMTTVTVASASTYYFRTVASNSYDEIWAIASQPFTTYAGSAQDRVWTGAGADSLASNPANWLDGIVPQAGDGVVLSSDYPADMTWDSAAPGTVASWSQGAGYTGSVTFETVYGESGFTVFTITGDTSVHGGVWTHKANGTTEANRLAVGVGGNLTIGADAAVDVTGRGYVANSGPGKSGWNPGLGGGGATHGGVGGSYNAHHAPRTTYGSVNAPENLGSGGGNQNASNPGIGGGAVKLAVGGATLLDGRITADGSSGAAGAAGGSVLLTTGSLSGNGTVTAAGGIGTSVGGAGGGGRVALILTGASSDFTNWHGETTAYGTIGSGSTAFSVGFSAAGTVYLQAGSGDSTLVVDNNGLFIGDTRYTLMPVATDLGAVDSIVIRNKGVLALRSDTVFDFNTADLVVNGASDAYLALSGDGAVTYPANWSIEGYTLRGEGITETLGNVTVRNDGALSHSANFDSKSTWLDIDISGDLVVEATGAVHANGCGYGPGYGPGKSGWSSAMGGGGATYGGIGGGYNSSKPIMDTYGSILSPADIGSGGGYNNLTALGWAGGEIILNVAGATVINGTLSANGDSGGSGPSGGSVNLTTSTLSGGGAISADGGPGTNVGGAGGGGRVAVLLTGPNATFSTWTGTITASGKNGSGGTILVNRSAAGTIFLYNFKIE